MKYKGVAPSTGVINHEKFLYKNIYTMNGRAPNPLLLPF